jgi:hypothetical protein
MKSKFRPSAFSRSNSAGSSTSVDGKARKPLTASVLTSSEKTWSTGDTSPGDSVTPLTAGCSVARVLN